MKLKNKVVWITGASSGIGEHLALALAKRGNKLILSSRRLEELTRVAKQCESLGGQAKILTLDLQDPNLHGKGAEALQLFGNIDVLINNGGISQRSYGRDTSIEIDRKFFEINFFSAVTLTKSILPHMIERKSGQIVAISSVVGFFGFGMRTAYSATKHAMKGFFESLRIEEAPNGVEVNVVYPGSIQTNISKNALNEAGSAHDKLDPRQARGMPADVCAERIIRGMERNKADILVGRRELILVYLRRYFPGLFYRAVSKIAPT